MSSGRASAKTSEINSTFRLTSQVIGNCATVSDTFMNPSSGG